MQASRLTRFVTEQEQFLNAVAAIEASEFPMSSPVLYAQLTISLWVSFEAAILDFAADFLAANRSRIKRESFADVRVRLGTFSKETSPRDQAKHILLEFLAMKGIAERWARIEAVLTLLGLTELLTDSQVRSDVSELAAVGEALLHNGGCADAQLHSLNQAWQVGEKLFLTRGSYSRYSSAVSTFVAVVITECDKKQPKSELRQTLVN